MPSFGEYIAEGLKDSLCAVLQGAGTLEDTFREILNPNDPNYGYLTRVVYSKYCDPPPPPLTEPPYTGGQCEFCYAVNIQWTQTDSENSAFDVPQNVTYNVWGPVEGVSVEKVGVGPTTSGASVPRIQAYGDCGAGRLTTATQIGTPQAPVDADTVITITSLSVTPRDGQPDICGDIPPELPPTDPNNRKFPIDLDFEYNDGTDFNIDGDVFFGFAYFDNDFNVNIPIKFVLENNVRFNGNINLDGGDVNINFGDDYDYPTSPPPEGDYRPDPDSPPPPPTTLPPPVDFEPPFPPNEEPDAEDSEDFDDEEPQEAPKFRRIIGVLVDTLVTPTTSTLLGQDVNPDVYVPDIGLVNFAYNIGGTRLYWGEDIRVKNRRQVIFTQSGRYAVAVSGTIRGGGQWVLTPIYQEVARGVGVG